MFDFWGQLVIALGNFLIKVVSSAIIMKIIVAAAVYALIFYVLPILILYLVPPEILGALSGYFAFLNSTTVGSGIGYFLGWFQFGTLCECMFVALSVRFIFRRF